MECKVTQATRLELEHDGLNLVLERLIRDLAAAQVDLVAHEYHRHLQRVG